MTGLDLDVSQICWGPSKRADLILHPTSFRLTQGRVMGVVGPNGAGKSTLLRILYRFHRPRTGTVSLAGQDIWSLPPRMVAQKVAAVLQEQPTDFALTVREIVALGRLPHRAGLAALDPAGEDMIDTSLTRLDLAKFAHRAFGTLSGGERQRVMIARALTQNPQVLVLDEPTNALDIRHQLDVLDLIGGLGMTIVVSLHDLNVAAAICDDILVLQNGRPLAFGPPDQVLDAELVSRAFHVAARREVLAPSGQPHFSFHLPSV